jgi:Tfp pilus assembly protein PilF
LLHNPGFVTKMNYPSTVSSSEIDLGRETGAGLVKSPGAPFGVDFGSLAFRKGLLLLFLAGLIIRAGFLIEHARTPSFAVPTLDQVYYDMVARMLLAGQDLHELHGFRPLLYPMFLAACYKLGGTWGPELAIVVQHILGVATGVFVALLGARMFRHRLSGLVGGALFLLAPVPLYFEGELLIEPTYIFLIFAALWLHFEAASKPGWKGAVLWLICGALIVLAAQARANIMVFLAIYPLFFLWRVVRAWLPSSLTPRLQHGASSPESGTATTSGLAFRSLAPLCGLLGALLMAIPWGIVNMRQSDNFHLLPNAGGVALYLGNKRTADGMTPEQERRIYSTDRYQDSIETWAREEYETAMRARGLQPDTDPMAVSRYWTHRTIEEIEADPPGWFRLMTKKTWLTFWNAEVPNNKAFAFLQQEYFWLRVLPVRWVVLLAFIPAGLWLAFRRGNRDELLILVAYTALYSAANIAFFICDRYRYPVWPTAAIFAGGGLVATLHALELPRLISKARALLFPLLRLRRGQGGGGFSIGQSYGDNSAGRFGSPALFLSLPLLMVSISLPNWFNARLPDFSRDYFFRSIAWYEKGHFREALEDITHSVELYPSEASAAHHRGNVLFALNRFAEAEGAYERALILSPGEAGVWNNLGATLTALGRMDEALKAYQRAMACTPPSRNAVLSAALVQIRLGRLADAAGTINQFEKLFSAQDPAALAIQSVLARRQGEIARADTLEQAARRLDSVAATWALERAGAGN